MNIDAKNIYFIGIGGIGMSALARYFVAHGRSVAGYDRTETPLTQNLENLGIEISYTDKKISIPGKFTQKQDVLVVYTPAIKEGEILKFFQKNNFDLHKRAEVLGELFNQGKGLAVAGTHGKTTTSAILAHIFKQSTLPSAAFVGGIMKNYNSNYVSDENPQFIIAEADEFDRSFLRLNPKAAVVTSMDADHLDIYGNKENIQNTFKEFIAKIGEKGVLFLGEGLNSGRTDIVQFTYGFGDEADIQATNIRVTPKGIRFDIHFEEKEVWKDVHLGISGVINVKNATAAAAMARYLGIDQTTIREALYSFKGIKRRFDIWSEGKISLVDDYAHHPEEIRAFLKGLRMRYPQKKLTAIFQPHLYTRTRDFADDFANVLSEFDEIILLPIYPAREKPIAGVNSELIFYKITNAKKYLVKKEELLPFLKRNTGMEVLATIGAGDIDREIEKIYHWIKTVNK